MTNTECLTCQIEAKRQSGQAVTNAELNHWMLWGCTCTPEAQAEAISFMTKITR